MKNVRTTKKVLNSSISIETTIWYFKYGMHCNNRHTSDKKIINLLSL